MAQINLTLNQEEILQLLRDDSGEAYKVLLQNSLNAILQAESTEQLGAKPYERCESRIGSRNGSRERPLTTRIGTIELTVPKHREVPFHTLVFENYKRSEAALITTMAEMVIGGVSTAKVGNVMETLCGTSFSKSAVSEACKELDDAVKAFQTRKLTKKYLFVMLDATYLKARDNHHIVSKALFVAIGLTEEGRKEIIGLDLYDAETKDNWLDFINSLHSRGLYGVSMFTSDAHGGIIDSLQKVYPDVPWQRCQAHFARDIVQAAPKKYRLGLKSELTEMFNCSSIEAARARRDEIIKDYKSLAPESMKCLDEGFDDAMTVMELPVDMRRCVRTSNYLERLNREIKRRSKVIGIFPNGESIIRLMGSFLMEENDRWSLKSRIYYKPSCEELNNKIPKLVEIAKRQEALREVA